MSAYLTSLGPLGFTYRLRRLSDRMQDSGRRLYDSLGVPLEPNWHILIGFLDQEGASSVTEVSAAMDVSHPAVIELARKLEDAGLLETSVDPSDGRRRVLSLSGRCRELLPEFQRLWATVGREIDVMVEATSGSDALSGLAAIEAQLDTVELDSRISHRLDAEAREPARPRREPRSVAVRAATQGDREAVLHIARELVRSADTYAYDPSISDDELWRYWRPADEGACFVADLDGRVVGMFVIRPNHPGPGSHVANASYAVRADVRGIGLGRQMGEASLAIAHELGYGAMQFNAVVSSNHHALRLWRSLGFGIVGSVPDGFRLPDGSYVPHHIMYRVLP